MTYNLTELESTYNLQETLVGVNSVSNGFFFTFFIIALFIILFIRLKDYETRRAFAAASFISTIVGILFFYAGLIPMLHIIILSIMTATATILLITEDG